MCMHSHFHSLLGIDLKWWLHECTTDHVIFLWDEDFRERKGGERERGPQTTSWECEIVDNYLLSKIQCLPDELELNLQKPTAPPTKMLQRKVMCEYVCMCVCMLLSLSVSIPSPSPFLKLSQTCTLCDKWWIRLPPNQLFKEEEGKKWPKRGVRKKKTQITS